MPRSGLFPHFQAQVAGELVGDELPQAAAPPAPVVVDMREGLHFPTLLHIVHNALTDLAKVLEHWSPFLANLTELCNLVRGKHSRDRLLETWFAEPPHVHVRYLYDNFDGHVYTGRWNTTEHAIIRVRSLEPSLRHAWSKQKYTFGKRAVPEPQNAAPWRVNVDDVKQDQQQCVLLVLSNDG